MPQRVTTNTTKTGIGRSQLCAAKDYVLATSALARMAVANMMDEIVFSIDLQREWETGVRGMRAHTHTTHTCMAVFPCFQQRTHTHTRNTQRT